MKNFDFRVVIGSRNFTKKVCAESYTIAYNTVTSIYPASAIIWLDKEYN